MAFNISYVYQIINKASRPLEKIAEQQKSVARGAEVVALKVKKFSSALGRLREKAKAAGSKLRGLGASLSLRITAPLGALAILALRSSANLETLQTSFESMLGSADKARDIMKKLVDFTARTPFQLEGVGQSAKQLLAFGVTTKELMPTLSVLGDISAGANVQLSEMAAIFGKVKAKGKAYTEELLQMSDRGIPIIDMLAKRFDVTKEAIFDAASKGKISFKILEDAMKQMTQKGGIFFAQMDRQSKTLAGIFSTLKDNVNLALGELGDTIVENLDLKQILKDVITGIQSATKAFSEFAKNNPKLTKFGVIVAGLVTILGPFIAVIGIMIAGFTLLSVPVLAAIAAFAALGLTATAMFVIWEDFMRGLQVIADFSDAMVAQFINGLEKLSNIAIAVAQPIIAVWNNVTDAISGPLSAITGVAQGIGDFFGSSSNGNGASQKIGDFFGSSGNGDGQVRAPGAQELTGRLGIDINLAGNTSAVESASARSIGRGNLGMNMGFAGGGA